MLSFITLQSKKTFKALRPYALIFCCLFSHLSFSSPIETDVNVSSLKFKKLSTEHGLTQGYISNIAQDLDGFIWIATEDGLERFDGSQLIHYRHNISDPNSIADNFIRKVFIDKKGVLWVGTNNGLSRYNKLLDNFDNFYHKERGNNTLADNEIWEIYEDLGKPEINQKPSLWIATRKGLHIFNREDETVKQIKIRGFEKKTVEVKTIFQDSNRQYWFGSFENGMVLANEKLSKAISLNVGDEEIQPFDATTLYDIKKIKQDLWLATDNGLYIVDRNYQVKKHLTEESTNNQLLSDQILSIETYLDDQVWLGTMLGLNVLNLKTKQLSSHVKNKNKSSLSGDWIIEIFKDQTNTLWLSAFEQGLNIFSPVNTKFLHELAEQSIDISAFTQASNEDIWFTSPQIGLNKISKSADIENNNAEQHSKVDIALPHIKSLYAGNDNDLWILSDEHKLYHLASDQKTLTLQERWLANTYNEASALVFINQTFWYINVSGSLSSYNVTTSDYAERYSDLTSSLNQMNYHYIDNNTPTLWLTTDDNKLLSYNILLNKFTQTPIEKHHNVQQFPLSSAQSLHAQDNWIWLTTSNNGVALVDIKNKALTPFNENHNLLNNVVSSLLIDSSDNAWVATSKGFSVVDPYNKEVRNFSREYQLSNNGFSKNVSLKTANNNFYFGGSNGYFHFNPENILDIKQQIPMPILTNLYLANKKISVASKKINNKGFTLPKPLNQMNRLSLTAKQFPFSVEFISPNAKLQQQIRYRYRLQGLEENWVEMGNRVKQATYTHLSSGNYTFQVEAYDSHHPELSLQRRLDITITPPWWLSALAVLIYILFGGAILGYFVQQIYHKRLYFQQIQLSEERLKLSLWGSGDEMWDWNITTGKVYRSNMWNIFEFPQDGRRNIGAEKTNLHPDDISVICDFLDQHFDKQTEHYEATYRVKSKEGKWIWVLDRGQVVERNNLDEPTRMTGTLKDISQIKKTDEKLKLFALCIENISDAIIIYDDQFTVVDVNKAYLHITQKPKEQVIGSSLDFTQYPERFNIDIKNHLVTKGGWHGEIEDAKANGEKFHAALNIDLIRDDSGTISHFVGVFSDITQRKQNEAELRKLANTDTLTTLPNRSYFQANHARLVSNKMPHALLVFDLDNFKKVNDTLGHELGDILLCNVAHRLLKMANTKDTVYRLGGDEFSLLIESTIEMSGITAIANEILKTTAQPFKIRNQEIALNSSIGIAHFPDDGDTPQELLKNADTAMYHAKDLNGNTYQYFNDDMNKKAIKRLQIENLIRHGLSGDFFTVFFQPKIDIATGKISGMEALARFETPTKGVISPMVFIPVSEETGQIIQIGEIVLRKACIATKRWVDAGLFKGRIAVNLSAIQFTQPNLVGMISNVLRETGLAAKYLELEITEGTVMNSPQEAISIMLEIRKMGINLSLDDFGTGYSSLAYLKQFPLNTLKIDKAFIDDIETSDQGRNMVATIVTIAHNLGLNVVAEGVETTQQLSFLSGLRCEQLQGYLYSKPLPERSFEKYLLSHQVVNSTSSYSQT